MNFGQSTMVQFALISLVIPSIFPDPAISIMALVGVIAYIAGNSALLFATTGVHLLANINILLNILPVVFLVKCISDGLFVSSITLKVSSDEAQAENKELLRWAFHGGPQSRH